MSLHDGFAEFGDPSNGSILRKVLFDGGNAGVGTERGPGAKILSLSLSKKFPVGERRWFEIRGEAFNLANTPIFNSPVSQTITSATFGENPF